MRIHIFNFHVQKVYHIYKIIKSFTFIL